VRRDDAGVTRKAVLFADAKKKRFYYTSRFFCNAAPKRLRAAVVY